MNKNQSNLLARYEHESSNVRNNVAALVRAGIETTPQLKKWWDIAVETETNGTSILKWVQSGIPLKRIESALYTRKWLRENTTNLPKAAFTIVAIDSIMSQLGSCQDIGIANSEIPTEASEIYLTLVQAALKAFPNYPLTGLKHRVNEEIEGKYLLAFRAATLDEEGFVLLLQRRIDRRELDNRLGYEITGEEDGPDDGEVLEEFLRGLS